MHKYIINGVEVLLNEGEIKQTLSEAELMGWSVEYIGEVSVAPDESSLLQTSRGGGNTTDFPKDPAASVNAGSNVVAQDNTESASEDGFSVLGLEKASIQLDKFGNPITIKAWEEETKDYIDKNPDLTADELSKWINRPGGPTESQYSFQEEKEEFEATKKKPKLDNPNYSPSNFIIDLYEDSELNRNKPALSAYDNEITFLKKKQEEYSLMSKESSDINSQIKQLEYNKENELEDSRTAPARERNKITAKINEIDLAFKNGLAEFKGKELSAEDEGQYYRRFNSRKEDVFENAYQKKKYEEQSLLLEEISTARTKDTYSSFGLSDLGENKEEKKIFDQKVEDEIINKLSANPKLIGKTLSGNLNIDDKKMIITEAKSVVLGQAYEDYLTEYNKAQEIIFASEESATIIPEVANAAQSILYKAANNLQATSAKLAFNIGEQSFGNIFQMTDDFYKWRDRHIDGGFIGGAGDFIGTLVQGGQQIIGESTAGFSIWLNQLGFGLAGTFEEDEYSRLDMVSDMFANYNSFNYLGVSPKGSSLSSWDDVSFRSTSKTIANMLPFTIGVALAARKGDVKGVKNAYSVLKGMGASPETVTKFKMGAFAFRATVNDNYMEGKQFGLTDKQAIAYSTMTSTATAVVQGIMPDVNFFRTSVGKAIKTTVIENLKKATTKEGIKAVSKQGFNTLLGELGEEEAELFLQDIAKITVGLSNEVKFFDWDTQFETIAGTILLTGSTTTVMAPAQLADFKNKIYNQYRIQGADIIATLQESKKVVEDKLRKARTQESKGAATRQLADINSAIEYGGYIIKAINVAPDIMNDEQIDLLIQKNQLLEKRAKADQRYTKGVNAEIEAIDAKIEASQVKQQSSIIEEKTEAGTKKIADALGITFTKGNTQEITELIAKENVAITERNIEKKDEDKEDLIDAEEALAQNGFIIQNKDGTQSIVVNEDVAGTNKAVTTAQHELLHGVLLKTITDNPGAIIQMSNALKSEIDKMIPTGVSFNNSYIQGRLEAYKEKPSSVQAEELLTIFSEGLTQGYISFEENAFTKIGDFIRQGLQKAGMNVTFNSGRDVFNFIKDFNKSVISGKGLGKGLTKAAKRGVKVGKKLGNTSAFLYDANFEANIKAVYNDTKIDLPKRALKIAIAYRPRMQELMNKSSNSVFGTSEKFQATEYALIGKNNANSILNTVLNYNPSSDISLDETIGRTIFGIGETAVTQKYSREADKAKIALDNIPYNELQSRAAQSTIATELPGMVKAQIIGRFNLSKQAAQDFADDVIEKLYLAKEPTKWNGQGDLYGFLNGRIALRIKDVVREEYKRNPEERRYLAGIDTNQFETLDKAANVVDEAPVDKKEEAPKYKSLSESRVVSKDAIIDIKKKVLSTVRTLKSAINASVSINKTVTPLIAEIKKELGKQVDINLKEEMGGKKDAVLEKYLLKNKKAILENMTTTWLMTAMPQAVQKQVDGKFTSDWEGKKIDREKTTTNQAGKTSGADIVRRRPNVANALSDADFLAYIIGKDGNPIRGRKESLAKAMAEEISLEIFNTELQNENSEISKAFENNQAARGVVLGDNFVEDIVRQSERGTIKFSVPTMKNMFYSFIEGDAAAVDNLYDTLDPESKAIWESISTQLDGGSQGYKQGLKVWKDAPNAIKGILAEYFKDNSKRDNEKAMKQLDVFSNKLIDALPNSLVKALGFEFFGAHFRYLNTTEGTKGGDIKNKIKLLEADGINLNFNTEDITIVQAGYGLVDKITKDVLNKKFDTVQDKIDYFNKNYKDKVDALNIANKQAAQAVLEAAFDIIAKDPAQAVGFLRLLESTTNIGKSLRGLTGISDIQFHAESQAVYLNTDTGSTYSNTLTKPQQKLFKEGVIVINEKHPNYKDAVKAIKDGSKQSLDQLLRIKGEHATSDAKKKLAIAKMVLDHVAIVMDNPTQLLIIKNAFAAKLAIELQNFSQQLNTKVLSDMQDSKLGSTSDIGDARLTVIPKESLLAFYDIEGIQIAGRVNRAFNDMFTLDKIKELAKVETEQKAINNARSIKWSLSPKKIRVFDFDDTLAITDSKVLYTMPNPNAGFSPESVKQKAIFMVGGPGAGKTNVGKGLQLGRQGYKVVNQDIALEAMKKESGLPGNESDYNEAQRSARSVLGAAAKKAAVDKFDKYAKNGDGMVIDGTGASYNATMKKVKQLEDSGYEVHMVIANTPLETALARNKARTERSLPSFIVEKTWKQVDESSELYRKDFGDRLYEINTESIEYGKALPVDFLQTVYEGINKNIAGKIDAATFAKEAGTMESLGAEWNFAEFSKIVDGKEGPLLEVAKIIADKRGTKDVFVLTARPSDAAVPIKKFLASMGLDIPIKNITGLGDGSPKAKADWITGKFAEGYNDFYFADDHTGNVKAVKDVLNALDVKSKVQQSRVKFSLSLDKEFNAMIERNKGVRAETTFSDIVAKKRGKDIGRFKLWMPSSLDDFKGLTSYVFSGSGRQGDADMEFFKKALIDPYFSGVGAIETAKQTVKNDFKALNKLFKPTVKKLGDIVPGTSYTYDQAIRVNLWTKAGYEIPGISKRDLASLNAIVSKDPELSTYSDGLLLISKNDEWGEPGAFWNVNTILSDLNNMTEKVGRKTYIAEFIENVDVIFSDKNLNKIEALYGTRQRDALEDIIYRMKNGTNRPSGTNKIVNVWNNWVNNSTGAIMFFNRKSAVLQLISTVNFMNWSDNNPLKAAAAFANQPQYWKDWVTIFNSDKLKQRRSGLKSDVNEAEIANAAANSTNKAQAALSYLLKIGFTPTQIADSFAIASGGASFYRNRINTYKAEYIADGDKLKRKYTDKEAEEKAWKDFAQVSDETQQSGDAALISMEQASVLGRLVLTFQNTAIQLNRSIKKSSLDLYKRRRTKGLTQFQSDASNLSKVIYYGAIQNIIFTSLQTALFSLIPGFDDDDEEENATAAEKKVLKGVNSIVDTMLKGGFGLKGAVVSTVKNMVIEYAKQEKKEYNTDHAYTILQAANLSPPIGSKLSKIYGAIQTKKFDQDVINDRGFSVTIDGKVNISPSYSVLGSVVSGTINLPLDRAITEVNSLAEAFDARNTAMQRIALGLGWRTWDVGTKNEENDLIKATYKIFRKEEGAAKAKAARAASKDEKDANLLTEERTYNKLEKLKKTQQIDSLEAYGLSKKEIRELPLEKDRINKIISLKGKPKKESKLEATPKQFSSALSLEGPKSYTNAPKNQVIPEIDLRFKELEKLKKGEQVDSLKTYGLSDKQIKKLKYEEDRVKKIIQLQDKKRRDKKLSNSLK